MDRCPVLIERDDELRALSALASETAGGSGARVVVITGEAGGGKSRLAQEFAASLPDVWSARMLRITRTGAALPAVPEARPLALILDDAHFLDPAAVESLPGLLNELGSEAVLVALTFRLGFHPAGSAEMRALAGLVRDPRALELRLMPLSPAGIEQMAAAMGRYATEDMYRRTGGNPFWAEEVLRGGEHVPWTVVETVATQIDALPPPWRDLAYALAVAEEPLPAAAAVRLVADLDGARAALVDAGLAQEETGGIALRHALLGEAIQARLGPVERAVWHTRLATALEAERAEPDRIARHWAAAGEAGRAAAIAAAAASELRAGGAIRRAYECFRLAVRRAPRDPETAAKLYEEAALTAARIGEYDATRSWITAADRLYREAGQPDRAARMLLDPTFDYLAVRRTDAIRHEPVERLLVEAQAAMARADFDRARGLIDAAVQAARSRSDGMALARAARQVLFALGEFERGEALLDEAVTFPDIGVHPSREIRVLTIRSCALWAQGQPLEALELLHRGVAISRHEPESVLWTGQAALGSALVLTGRLDEGASTFLEAFRPLPRTHSIVAIVDGFRRFERGDVDGGIAAIVGGTDQLLTEFDFDPLGRAVTASHVLVVRALAEAHGGRPAAAIGTVQRIDTLSPEPYSDVGADLAYVLARAAVDLGDGNVLERARQRIGDIARVAAGPAVIAAAEAVRGCSARAEGQAGEAGRHFQAAAALFERAPRPVLAAELWCDAAQVAGTGSAAVAALERARRVCDAHGLLRVAARETSLREGLSAHPARAPTALTGLTSRERDVVLLAADGLSNRAIGTRLYLSEGTVRNYLSTAFGKLGVSRRAELGRLVAAAQLTD